MQTPKDTPVFILCGGLGTRIKEETEFRPKPMVPVGPHPMLWHIMHLYSKFGFRRFILCLGFKAEVIKAYFLDYPSLNSDFTIDLKTNNVAVHSFDHAEDWEVTLVDTGHDTMTGGRLFRAAEKYLGDAEHAAVTYGDGLCNVNLADELMFHQEHGRIGTVLGVNPPSRFGEIQLDGNNVTEFCEKPDFNQNWINGGFFFFQKPFFRRYLSSDPACILERTPLVNLARDNQLTMYRHTGFWACMDTQRDREQLNQMWASGEAPWLAQPPQRLEHRELAGVNP
ncbi:MAG: glucose-1-phosphate cytidylyltransferase [Chlamydiales bacterium]|nr:glucose-1-phosphate cytidylyltransferase [Chlamydiales bacterium]